MRIYSILFIFCLSLTGCLEEKAPMAWQEWTEKLVKRYQEPYSNPSIVHYVYLNKMGDKAFGQLASDGFRWTSDFSKLSLFMVQWENLQTVRSVSLKNGRQFNLLKENYSQIDTEGRIFLSAKPIPSENKMRVFIHDMKQPDLAKKRVREFFTYNKDSVVQGRFQWLKEKKQVTISRSDGTSKEMNIIAQINWDSHGKNNSLSIYDYGMTDDEIKKQKEHMLLYRDYSNGKQTYGAGRFVDIELTKPLGELKDNDSVTVDFNFSYNPPCAVSTGFHCPLPQDVIAFDVLAGEKYSKN